MRHSIRSRWAAKRLLGQAQELLSGAAVNGYGSRGTRAPGWAWVNLLAHSRYDQLAALATRAGRGGRDGWAGVASSLAQDLVRLDLSGISLRELQRSVLIPLELDLLGGRQPEPATPTQLLSVVRGALGHHPIGQ